MQGMRQSGTEKFGQAANPAFWQSREAPTEALAIEVAAEGVDLLPELEEFLRTSMLDARHVPGREGLLG